jgi:hypothetical protein
MKPYKLIPPWFYNPFHLRLRYEWKESNYKTSDYNKYLRVNGNESLDFANKMIFWQNKYNAAPNQKLLGYNSI